MGRIARNVVGVSVAECARQLAALHGITITDMAIHRAIKAGRVPRHPDGSVDVEAVRLGMQLTADPTRGGQRQAGVVGVMGGSPLLMVGDRGAADIQPSATATIADAQLQLLQARATGETALAQRRTLELSQMMGRVAEVEPMLRAVQDVVIAARSELQALPDRMTPMLTPETDPGRVYALLEAEVSRITQEMSRKLRQSAQMQMATVGGGGDGGIQ
jgi:hypothetical protein